MALLALLVPLLGAGFMLILERLELELTEPRDGSRR